MTPLDKNNSRLNKAFKAFTENPSYVFLLALLVPLTILVTAFIALNFEATDTSQVPRLFVQLIPTVLTSTAVLFSALWASTFAVQNMRAAQETARLRETLNIIRDAELDAEFIKAKNVWANYRSRMDHHTEFAKVMAFFILAPEKRANKDPQNLPALYDEKTEKEVRTDAEFLGIYFNFFELVSLSISKKILDEDFFKAWHATNFIRVWNYSVAAIGAMRILHSNDRLYSNWERQARKWGQELQLRVSDVKMFTLPDLVQMTDTKS